MTQGYLVKVSDFVSFKEKTESYIGLATTLTQWAPWGDEWAVVAFEVTKEYDPQR